MSFHLLVRSSGLLRTEAHSNDPRQELAGELASDTKFLATGSERRRSTSDVENYRSADSLSPGPSVLLQARHQRAIFGRKARFKSNQLLVWAGTDISKARSLPAPIGVTLIESDCASSSTLYACAGPNEASPTVLGPDV
jgi:hypothetical protein